MNNFLSEVKQMPTADIALILEDQLDLYSEEEISILRAELKSRATYAPELENSVAKQLHIIHELEQQEKLRKEREQQEQARLERLQENGGYYEYKVVSLSDIGGLFNKNSGRVDTEGMTRILNELGFEGWHLITAYSNELGKNALSGATSGLGFGVNSTVDENILIFERFVKI